MSSGGVRLEVWEADLVIESFRPGAAGRLEAEPTATGVG